VMNKRYVPTQKVVGADGKKYERGFWKPMTERGGVAGIGLFERTENRQKMTGKGRKQRMKITRRALAGKPRGGGSESPKARQRRTLDNVSRRTAIKLKKQKLIKRKQEKRQGRRGSGETEKTG